MNFISVDFFRFIAIVWPSYYLLPQRFRVYFLLAASYFFYGYWSKRCLVLLIAVMVTDYFLALRIERAQDPKIRWRWLLVSLTMNLGVLFLFKYFNFFSDVVGYFSGRSVSKLNLILPFGISFYTFHTLSYIFDVYRQNIRAERNFVKYSSYVMFFPQLVAGPIARAPHLLHQFSEKKPFRVENLIQGSYWIARGYFFKVILADNLAPFVDMVYARQINLNPVMILEAFYFFTFQLYFDFSGYTDIARGLAKCFGFELVVNFNRPFQSASITELWTRWHISFSTWIRDYVYTPLAIVCARRSRWLLFPAVLFTFFLAGLWHGANVTFIVFGLLNGLFIVVEGSIRRTRWGKRAWATVPRGIQVFIAFHLFCFSLIFFRSESMAQAFEYIGRAGHAFRDFSLGEWAELAKNPKLWLGIGFAWWFEIYERKGSLYDRYQRVSWPVRTALLYLMVLFIDLFSELAPRAFVYFQF